MEERHYIIFDCSDRSRVLPVVWYLISKNSNVEAREDRGHTILMIASLLGHAEIAKILLEDGGAKVNFCNARGETALNMALSSNRSHRTIPTLLQYGANVAPHKITKTFGWSILQRACIL